MLKQDNDQSSQRESKDAKIVFPNDLKQGRATLKSYKENQQERDKFRERLFKCWYDRYGL